MVLPVFSVALRRWLPFLGVRASLVPVLVLVPFWAVRVSALVVALWALLTRLAPLALLALLDRLALMALSALLAMLMFCCELGTHVT